MSLRTRMQGDARIAKVVFNCWPCVRGTGARITHLSRDWSELRLRLPLSWRTRNYVGTIFGGSLIAAADPWYMLMLMHRLGSDYVVWDKSASVRFRRPARTTLYATVRVDEQELQTIRSAVAAGGHVDRTYVIDLADAGGLVHATVEKLIYVASREDHERRAIA